MASLTGISKRSDGRWTVKYKGKQTTCKTETEAKRKLKELKSQDKRVSVSLEKLTVSDAVKKWLLVKKTTLKPRSYDRLEQTWTNQVKDYIGNLQFASLSGQNIEDMLIDLYSRGYSYSSVKKCYDFINACCKYYHKKGEISGNPAVFVEVPAVNKKPKGDISVFSEEELQEIYTIATKEYSNGIPIYRQGWAIVLLGNTGLRFCELSGLTWSNVDMKNKIIHVRDTRVTVKNRDPKSSQKTKSITQSTTKTESGRRDVPMNSSAYQAMENLLKIKGESQYVLSSRNGTPTGQKVFDTTFRRIQRAAGIPEEKIYGVHALRHSFATAMIRKGVSSKVVSKLLGHSDINITLQTYVHALQDDYLDAVSVLD